MSRVLTAVTMTIAGIAAGAQITSVYAGREAFWAIAAAGFGAALVWLVTGGHRAWHLPVSIAGLAGLLTGLQYLMPAPDGLLAAFGNAGARLLTIAPPLPSRVDTLLLPVVATWICVASGCALAGSRRPALAMLPPALLATGMLVLVGPRREAGYVPAAALVAALCLALAVNQVGRITVARAAGDGRVRPRLTGLGVAVVIAALLAGFSGLATPAVLVGAGTTPPDLRSVLLPPVLAPTEVHPLSLLGRWQANPELALFTVDSTESVPLRWAVLTEFDGVSWRPAAVYRAAGGDRAVGGPSAVPVRTVQATVTVLGLTGAWLPVPDGLRRVSGVSVAIDDEATTLVVPDGLRAGQTYEVVADVPQPTPEQLAVAHLPASSEFDRYRQLPPGNTGPIVQLAVDAAGTALPYAQAIALAEWLKTEYRYDPLAPGGSGYPSINRFLTADPSIGGRRGTSEQFAAAYAVLARALGIPARVVVGFVPDAESGEGPVTVTAGHARAWPEIYIEPVGWVAIDVTAPRVDEVTPPDQPRPSRAAVPPTSQPTPAPAVASPQAPAGPSVERPASSSPSGWPWWFAGAALLPLAAGLVALARLHRSRRRLTGPDPHSRVRGAWAELVDGARLAGLRLQPQWTVTEVVAAVGRAVGITPTDPLVAAVNRVAFAAGPAEGDDQDYDLAVAQARDLVQRARQRAGPLRRALWWLDPRPLWW
jgi:Transglutaminase-like enzymes, putative cysteine proteases